MRIKQLLWELQNLIIWILEFPSHGELIFIDMNLKLIFVIIRCKKHGVPVEKIFNKTQRDKFRWAIEMATEDYEF